MRSQTSVTRLADRLCGWGSKKAAGVTHYAPPAACILPVFLNNPLQRGGIICCLAIAAAGKFITVLPAQTVRMPGCPL